MAEANGGAPRHPTAGPSPSQQGGVATAAQPAPAPVPEPTPAPEAAVVEVSEPTEHKITVRGREFTLPPKQPFRAVAAARGIVAAQKTGDQNAAAVALIDIAEAYIGPEQMAQQILPLDDSEEGFLTCQGIVEAANKLYGSAEGESTPSQSS